MRTSMPRGNDSKHHAPDELERIASWVIVFEAFFPSMFQPLSASMRISLIAQAKPSKEIEQKKAYFEIESHMISTIAQFGSRLGSVCVCVCARARECDDEQKMNLLRN